MLALKPGDTFERDFQVLKLLAEGGMGTLWVVRQQSTGKKRVLKLMLKNAGNDEDARRRFAQEARVGSMIESEHIVEVIAAGVDEESNTPWLIMELLEGEDLDTIITRGERFSPMLVHDLFEQLCHALGAAHELPVVHRDLKPENIFLARARVANAKFLVKLLDFGIAKILVDGASSTGSVGTPLWMPPEQAKSNAITPAADVWSLGLIAFYLLSGKIYWIEGNRPDNEADVMALLREVLFDDLPPASARAKELQGKPLPDGFDAWFARCVARDPKARFQNAREAFQALSPILKSADNFEGEGEFTLRIRSTTDGVPDVAPSAPSGSKMKTAGAVSVSQDPGARKVSPLLLAGAGVTLLVVVLGVALSAHKTDATAAAPKITSAPPSAPSAPSLTTSALAVSASSSNGASPTTLGSASHAPTAKPTTKPSAGSVTTSVAPPQTTSAPTATTKPSSNPLNMGIQ